MGIFQHIKYFLTVDYLLLLLQLSVTCSWYKDRLECFIKQRALPDLMLILGSLFHRLLYWSGRLRQAQGACLGGSLTEISKDQFTLSCLSKIIWNKIKCYKTSTIHFHSELKCYTCGASYSFWLLKQE